MATLSDAGLAYLRSEVGDEISDDDLFERFERLGDVRHVALEVIRGRIADILSGPSAFNVTGVYSEDNTSGLRTLQAQLNRLASARVNAETGAADTDGLFPVNRAKLKRIRQR